MEVLVLGAGGYIGSRLVPALRSAGHTVRAGFRDPGRAEAFHWGHDVDPVPLDVTRGKGVDAAVDGADAVCYLVHSMARPGFAEADRTAARTLADAAEAAGVSRVCYLSGLVPDVAPEQLSEHIASRLEVESILMMSAVPTLSLRAGLVVGSGSTSFEVVRQLSERLPVQVVPTWLTARVQPVAVVDVVAALVGAVESSTASRTYDVGGPDVVAYRQLLTQFADAASLLRPQVDIPLLPQDLVGQLAGVVTDVPAGTLRALVRSLEHDMVCAETDFQHDLLPEWHEPLGLGAALERALAAPTPGLDVAERDPMGPLPGDPSWAGSSPSRSPLDWAVAMGSLLPLGLLRLWR